MPLVTGAAVGLHDGGDGWLLAPLTIAVMSLFWLRTPVESWVGSTPIKARSSEEIRLVRNTCGILAGIGLAALAWLFWGWRNGGLVWVGIVALAAFLGQAVIRKVWKKARTAGQMVGAAGLTSVGAAAYYVVTNRLGWTAWSLWILNLLFAANQIQFVQLRIRAAQIKARAERMAFGRGFLAAQGITITLLVAGCGADWFSWNAAAAFLPVLWRGFAWFLTPFRPLAVHALGKRELANAILFGVLLIVAMCLP